MKIQLKRSNQLNAEGSAKEPTVGQMEYGELAVNYNATDPSLFIKDSADNIIKLKVVNGAQVFVSPVAPDPADYAEGTLWWNSDSTSGQMFILYNDPDPAEGLKWVEASPSTGGSGGGGAEVLVSETAPDPSNLAEGSLWWNSSETELQLFVLYNDNGTLKWVEASPTVGDGGAEEDFVNVTGDNMTGDLTLGTDKITLGATSGSAEFAGNVTALGGFVVKTNEDGIDSQFVSTMRGEFGDYSNYTRGLNKDGVITWGIESSDGSAEFKGTVKASVKDVGAVYLISTEDSFWSWYGFFRPSCYLRTK